MSTKAKAASAEPMEPRRSQTSHKSTNSREENIFRAEVLSVGVGGSGLTGPPRDVASRVPPYTTPTARQKCATSLRRMQSLDG